MSTFSTYLNGFTWYYLSTLLVVSFLQIKVVSGRFSTSPSSSSSSTSSSSTVQERCQTEQLDARCGPNEVVVMTSAKYGRMKISRCVDRNYGYLGCSSDVLSQSDLICSGRRSCSITVPNAIYESIKTLQCPKDLKSYLEASYICLPGQPCLQNGVLRLRASAPYSTANTATADKEKNGVGNTFGDDRDLLLGGGGSSFISSVLTEETDQGSVRCPWLIEAELGQRINITLWDFSHEDADTGGGVGGSDLSRTSCHAYAVLRDTNVTQSKTVCGGGGVGGGREKGEGGMKRVSHAFMSQGNRVEVRIQKTKRLKHFLLQYNVFGCADPEPSRWAWFVRDGNNLRVGCSGGEEVGRGAGGGGSSPGRGGSPPGEERLTGETWTLVCNGTHWIGPINGCNGIGEKYGEVIAGRRALSWGNSLIAVLTISGIFSVIILVVGLLILRCHKRNVATGLSSSRQGQQAHINHDITKYDQRTTKPPSSSDKIISRQNIPGGFQFTSYPTPHPHARCSSNGGNIENDYSSIADADELLKPTSTPGPASGLQRQQDYGTNTAGELSAVPNCLGRLFCGDGAEWGINFLDEGQKNRSGFETTNYFLPTPPGAGQHRSETRTVAQGYGMPSAVGGARQSLGGSGSSGKCLSDKAPRVGIGCVEKVGGGTATIDLVSGCLERNCGPTPSGGQNGGPGGPSREPEGKPGGPNRGPDLNILAQQAANAANRRMQRDNIETNGRCQEMYDISMTASPQTDPTSGRAVLDVPEEFDERSYNQHILPATPAYFQLEPNGMPGVSRNAMTLRCRPIQHGGQNGGSSAGQEVGRRVATDDARIDGQGSNAENDCAPNVYFSEKTLAFRRPESF